MIRNTDTGKYLSGYPEWACDPLTRMCGMLFRRFVCGKFDALVFNRCGSVHTFFMRFPLDLVFLDKNNCVVSIRKKCPPGRVVFGGRGAVCVIELPPGAIDFSETSPGNRIDLESTLSRNGIEKISSEAILLSESYSGKR